MQRLLILFFCAAFFPLAAQAGDLDDPVALANEWLELEARVGDEHWARIATVATASKKGEVHVRSQGLTSLTDAGAVFYTHKNSRKVQQLKENPVAAVNLWMPNTVRQISIQGRVEFVSDDEAALFWKSYHRRGKLMFLASDHVSKLEDPSQLRERYEELERTASQEIPMPAEFVGFRVVPNEFVFYEIRTDDLPRKIIFYKDNGNWIANYYHP